MSATLVEQSNYSIILTDIQGRQIEEIDGVNTTKYFSHTFDMQNKPAGMYYITLKSGSISHQKRIILVN